MNNKNLNRKTNMENVDIIILTKKKTFSIYEREITKPRPPKNKKHYSLNSNKNSLKNQDKLYKN